MSLILEQQKPRLARAVYIHVDFNRAGVDFLGFIQLVELAVSFQILHCNRSQIHQADWLGSAKLLSYCQILLIGGLQQLILKCNIVNNRQEGGMAAVVRPVGVYHPDFGDGRVAVLRLEVVLTEGYIIRVHGKTVLRYKVLKTLPVELCEALEGARLGGDVIFNIQGFRLFKGGFARFNRVDNVFFDFRDFGVA